MLIDCDSCTARGPACDDCVVSVMLGPVAGLELDDTEHRALQALAEGGLVPRLRLTVAEGGSSSNGSSSNGSSSNGSRSSGGSRRAAG